MRTLAGPICIIENLVTEDFIFAGKNAWCNNGLKQAKDRERNTSFSSFSIFTCL
jgi:hypothetical protein